jgi:hypothetical protein
MTLFNYITPNNKNATNDELKSVWNEVMLVYWHNSQFRAEIRNMKLEKTKQEC